MSHTTMDGTPHIMRQYFKPYAPFQAFYKALPNKASRLSAGLLSLTLLLGTLNTPGYAGWLGGQEKSNKKQAAVIQPFLPPVASINSELPVEGTPAAAVDPLEPVSLAAIESPSVCLNGPVNRLEGHLAVQNQLPQVQSLVKVQQALEEQDLNRLWEATVEQNPVIRFSLEKMAIPADLQNKHSSKFLTKTMGLLISGASMGATMLPGGGYYRNMGAIATGDVLRNLMSSKNPEPQQLLSPTEQIQLAGLVDELKAKLVQAYHDYKNTLQSLYAVHTQTMKANTLYAEALKGQNPLVIISTGSAYHKALLDETRLRQKAKLYRIQLERLAGRTAVEGVQLSQYIPDEVIQQAKKSALPPSSSSEPISTVDTVASNPVPEDAQKTDSTDVGENLIPPASNSQTDEAGGFQNLSIEEDPPKAPSPTGHPTTPPVLLD
ncbi:MAG: hypothetical protein SFZ03_11145 [Candidatus Melainabacteria bacterium]|nr:hypothetical protein [Candidatus Melainabacteria bacterium]